MKKLLSLTLALIIALTSFQVISFAAVDDDYDFTLKMMVRNLNQEIVEDEEFDILVYTSRSNINTYTYQLGLEFDTKYFEFVESKSLIKDSISGIEVFDNEKGTATVAYYIDGDRLEENDDDNDIYELLIVTFKTKKEVNRGLTFKFDEENTMFLNEDGEELTPELEDFDLELPDPPRKDEPSSKFFYAGDSLELGCATRDVEYYYTLDDKEYPDKHAVGGKITLPKKDVTYYVIARKYGLDSDIAEIDLTFRNTLGGGGGNGGGGGGISGTYVPNTQTGTTTTPTVTPNTNQNVKYGDIAGHWAESFIKELINKKIINGYEDGTVKPGNTITRAEIAKMIVCALGQGETTPALEFKDADTIADWAAGYIQTAVNLGILNGYEDNTFKPSQPITRQELAKIAMVAFKMGESDTVLSFTDNAKIPDWSRKYVASAVDSGIITGYPDGTFLPENNVTRAEACTIISKCLK